MAAIFFNGVEPFKQIVNTLSTEGSMWNLMKIALAVSEKKQFKISPNNLQGTKSFTTLSYTVSFSH